MKTKVNRLHGNHGMFLVLKPIWTYGISLWGTASISNINILQRFQSKALRMILKAPWFVSNATIHKDSKILFVEEEILKFSSKYLKKLENHTNYLALNLLDNSQHVYRPKDTTLCIYLKDF
jgi:regulatory protein YycI of two-component signal transduction system YycFG